MTDIADTTIPTERNERRAPAASHKTADAFLRLAGLAGARLFASDRSTMTFVDGSGEPSVLALTEAPDGTARLELRRPGQEPFELLSGRRGDMKRVFDEGARELRPESLAKWIDVYYVGVPVGFGIVTVFVALLAFASGAPEPYAIGIPIALFLLAGAVARPHLSRWAAKNHPDAPPDDSAPVLVPPALAGAGLLGTDAGRLAFLTRRGNPGAILFREDGDVAKVVLQMQGREDFEVLAGPREEVTRAFMVGTRDYREDSRPERIEKRRERLSLVASLGGIAIAGAVAAGAPLFIPVAAGSIVFPLYAWAWLRAPRGIDARFPDAPRDRATRI